MTSSSLKMERNNQKQQLTKLHITQFHVLPGGVSPLSTSLLGVLDRDPTLEVLYLPFYIYIFIHTQIFIYIYVYLYMYIYIHVYHIHIYIYTCIYIYIHISISGCVHSIGGYSWVISDINLATSSLRSLRKSYESHRSKLQALRKLGIWSSSWAPPLCPLDLMCFPNGKWPACSGSCWLTLDLAMENAPTRFSFHSCSCNTL